MPCIIDVDKFGWLGLYELELRFVAELFNIGGINKPKAIELEWVRVVFGALHYGSHWCAGPITHVKFCPIRQYKWLCSEAPSAH